MAKKYIIEAKAASRKAGDPEPEWDQVSVDFADPEKAEEEFDRLDGVWGHDTYHRLVKIKREVLRTK